MGQIASSCCCYGFISPVSGLYGLSVIPMLLNVKETKGPHSMSTGAAVYSNETGFITKHQAPTHKCTVLYKVRTIRCMCGCWVQGNETQNVLCFISQRTTCTWTPNELLINPCGHSVFICMYIYNTYTHTGFNWFFPPKLLMHTISFTILYRIAKICLWKTPGWLILMTLFYSAQHVRWYDFKLSSYLFSFFLRLH